MTSLLSQHYTQNKPTVYQHTGKPSSARLDLVDQLLIVLPKRDTKALWAKIPQGERIRSLMKLRGSDSVPAVVSRLPNKRQSGVLVAKIDASTDTYEQLTLSRKLVAAAMSDNPRCIGVWAIGFSDAEAKQIVSNVTAAVLAASFVMPAFKSSKDKAHLTAIRIFGLAERLPLERLLAEAEGNNFVRWLTAMPPNKLDAREYAAICRGLAKSHGWQYKRYGTTELTKLGAGAFLAVAQGNDNDSASIICLKYRPGGKTKKAAVSLVGKGIIFDTGGTNLKPFTGMLDMHTDMSGSAVALSTFKAISDLQLPIAADCWLAITENRTGPKAYKSQDILTAANGTTIQTIHTDAEGRLALADTLVLASREKPGMIIDFATLTGACVVGISERYSGVFSNRAKLHPLLKRAGRLSGERVWPFPIGDEYVEALKGDTADLKQCTASGGGDHIYAASFLGEFVDKDIPWVHVDLSACTVKGGLAHVPTDITGFGVRYTLNLLLDQGVMDSGK